MNFDEILEKECEVLQRLLTKDFGDFDFLRVSTISNCNVLFELKLKRYNTSIFNEVYVRTPMISYIHDTILKYYMNLPYIIEKHIEIERHFLDIELKIKNNKEEPKKKVSKI